MKHLFLLPLLVLSAGVSSFAQRYEKISPIAAALFKDIRTKLTVTEQNNIAAKLGFVLSDDKEQPFAQDKDSKEHPFTATVLPTDMNKDGIEEVFVSFGNTYTSGNDGSSIVLFIKSAAGQYSKHLGFSGMVPEALATSSKGYPDLLIGGAGMQFPVYRWNGKTYAQQRIVKDTDYDKLHKMSIEEMSRMYMKGQLSSIYSIL